MNEVLPLFTALLYFADKVIKAYHPAVMYGKLGLLNIIKQMVISFLLPFVVWLFQHPFHFKIWPALDIISWVLGR